MSTGVKSLDSLKDSVLLYEKKLPAFGYMIIIIIALFLASVVAWSVNTSKIYMVKPSGIVQSTNKNHVMSPYTGEIVSINISEGTLVEEGAVLFVVKSTDLDLQYTQLAEQKTTYETTISQYEKLVKSIKDDTNYFDQTNTADSLYYSQYELYKSQVAQKQIDTSTYQSYGYSEEQIEAELVKNQNAISEIYYTAINTAESAILQAQTQLDTINAQLLAVEEGQGEYEITASETGTVHMMADYEEGMVVQAAAALASISSENDEYVIYAYASPDDTAKINVGDKVDIAVSGLTQSVYGTITGEVTGIDSDVTTSESSSDDGSSSSYFKIEIVPDYNYLVSKDGEKVNIYNGMAVEARIQYDKVTYFDYVLEALGVLTR